MEKIYHYTSPEGMFSILQNKAFRFTDCQFFNDELEYIYIKKPLCDAISKLQNRLLNKDLIEDVDSWLVEKYEVRRDVSKSKMRYYVFCTSKEADSLNMWNYYLKNGKYQGYNIGISLEKILQYINEIDLVDCEFWQGKVMYSFSEQVEYLINYIEMLDYDLYCCRKEAKTIDDDYGMLLAAQEEIIEKMEFCRLFFKTEAFVNEQEYRFVLRIPEDINKCKIFVPGFMIKEGIFIPYYDLKIREDIIESIMISPMLEEELAKKGVELFLKKQKTKNIIIKKSQISIRY